MFKLKHNLCYGFLAFLGWTVTSFFCHQSAKLFLGIAVSDTVLDYGFVWALVITLAQVTMCHLLTDLHLFETRTAREQIIFMVKVACHVLATLATNYSMTLVRASSTFAIKLLEPITSAIVQSLVLETALPLSTILSLPLTVAGALVFCGGPSLVATGVVMAFVSNVILAFRNVAIKLEQEDLLIKTLKIRQTNRIIIVLTSLTCLVIVVEYLTFQKILKSSVAFLVLTTTSSSLFHVIYSYISTNVMLLYMTVVSHSVANIFKRICVVLLLYAVGKREANLTNLTGLAVSVLGLIIYVQSKVAVDSKDDKEIKGICGKRISIHFTFSTVILLVTSVGLLVASFQLSGPVTYTYGNKSKELPLILPPLTYNTTDNGTATYIAEMFPPLLLPNSSLTTNTMKRAVQEFLQRKLINTPQETDVLSPLLKTTMEVIEETQRVHMNLFSDLIGPFRYAVLFDVATYENKGDPAISVGETYLIRRLGLKLLYYCNLYACTMDNLKKVKVMIAPYPVKEVVVLLQGGGNLVGYEFNDKLRARIFKLFGQYQSVLFPQSILIRPNKEAMKHLEYCKKLYQKQTNLTIILRDRQSLWYAKEYFQGGPRLFLAPDMAFQIGHVPRFISPMFDILWIKRNDSESPNFEIPDLPAGITVHVSDWWKWKTPRGTNSMETAFLITNNGLIFLQRGRVVITDRLHGHILSTLVDIPHVLIDNQYRKLSMFHNSWTSSLENVVLVHSAEDAVKEAVKLLHKYENDLPRIIPYMDLNENPLKNTVRDI